MGCCTNYKRITETSVGNVQEIHFHFPTDYTEVVFFNNFEGLEQVIKTPRCNWSTKVWSPNQETRLTYQASSMLVATKISVGIDYNNLHTTTLNSIITLKSSLFLHVKRQQITSKLPKQTCLSNSHYSFLNMSLRSLSIGTVPIVFLKKRSSISLALIRRKAGNKRSRRPNRASWVGHWARTYSPSMSWAWSWVDSTCSGSLSPQAANKIVQMKISIVNWL